MTDDEPTARNTNRRSVLQAAGGLTLGSLLATTFGASAPGSALPMETRDSEPGERQPDRDPDTVFPQGVASGDPTTEGMILWTRIAPEVYDPSAPLVLEVMADRGFERFGPLWTIDTGALPNRDYTVKVDLDGHLEPGREYYYRFHYDGVRGPIGRCRTLPAADTTPESVRFAVVTCQDYRNGYYGAFHHVANADVDWLVHLGDVIYEHGGPSAYEGRDIELPSGHDIAWTLGDFRHLYRTYRSDRFMQDALASAGLIATWDDHEIVNDRFWDYEADVPGVSGSAHPRAGDPEFLVQLFADGIRAWWEYMPVRVQYDPDADSVQDQLQLYRAFQFGDLVDLVVTDERLFRSRPDENPNGDLPDGALEAPGDVGLEHTMLGADQRAWFIEEMCGSDATWTVWANEVLNMHFQSEYGDLDLFSSADAWDGYETERRLIMEALARADLDNVVALTGDLHTALAGYLQTDYGRRAPSGERVGVELMTPALTSANLAETVDVIDNSLAQRFVTEAITSANDHLEFFDSYHHGYSIVEFTPDACAYTPYAVDKSVDSADARRRPLAFYRIPEGDPVLRG